MSFFLASIKNNQLFRSLLLITALSLPVSPIVAADFTGWFREHVMGEKSTKDEKKKLTKEEKEKQKAAEQEAVKRTALEMLGDYALTSEDQADFLAQAVTKGGSKADIEARIVTELKNGRHVRNAIMTNHEMKELDLEWLINKIDRTQTSLGKWGLLQTFYPTDDINHIKIQQARVKALVDDPQLFATVEKLLSNIKKYEKSMIIYWQGADQAQSLYWDLGIPFIGSIKPLNKFLNKRRWALEFSALYSIGLAFKNVAYQFFLMGLWQEFIAASENKNRGFHPIDGLWRGIKDFKNAHDPFPTDITKKHTVWEPAKDVNGNPIYDKETGKQAQVPVEKEGYGKRATDLKDALFDGTAGDRYVALSKGTKSWIPILDMDVPAAEDMRAPLPTLSKITAFGGVAAGTALYDLYVFNNMYGAVRGLAYTIKTTAELRERMFDVADFVKTTREIAKLIGSHAVFAKDCMAVHMNQVFSKDNPTSKEFKECLGMLKTGTFKRVSTVGEKYVAYSRGRLLLTNRLFMKHKHHMLPALRAIAELDAAFSMAKLYKEHLNTSAPFTFVEFINSDKITIELRDVWMPYFGDKDPVQNDILFGGEHSQVNWLITGPNGGGKSAMLKNGIPIAMAQSWGIVPAKSARMTIINGLRTCTNAKENMRAGESTFMAESRTMERLYDYIKQVDPTGKYMVIADEPYRGTVNDETARRTGMFCEEVSAKPHIGCIIATHIMPVLSAGTQNIFSYYHVGISEPTLGQFVRTYKLAPGLCDWWFNDINRRSRYVDWLKTVSSDKNQE